MEILIALFNGHRKSKVTIAYDERPSLVGAKKDDAPQTGATKPKNINIDKFLAPRTTQTRTRKVSETTKTVHTFRLSPTKSAALRMNIDTELADKVDVLPNYEGDVFVFKKNIRLFVTLVGVNRILEIQFIDRLGNAYFTFGVAIGTHQINAVLHSLEFQNAVKNGKIEHTKDDNGRVLVKQVTIQN